MRYDGFISYSHAADGKVAPELQKALQRMANPTTGSPRACAVHQRNLTDAEKDHRLAQELDVGAGRDPMNWSRRSVSVL
jgi:hypothetical protein